MNSSTRKKYALIWGIIFFIVAIILGNFDGSFFKFLFYISIGMTVLSILTLLSR